MKEKEGLSKSERERGSQWGLVALAGLSGVAVILAGVGIYLGWKASKELATFRKDVDSRPNQVGDLRAEVESFEKRLENVGAVTVRINNNLEALHDQAQRTLSDQTREFRSVREGQNEAKARLERLESGSIVIEVDPRMADGDASMPESVEASIPNEGYHLIKSGENFEKLANRYGVSAADFINANPELDPRKLQIGQKVKIPQ